MPLGLAELGDAVSCLVCLPVIALLEHLPPTFHPLAYHSTTLHKRADTQLFLP